MTELFWTILSGHRKILASFERNKRIEKEDTVLFTELKKTKVWVGRDCEEEVETQVVHTSHVNCITSSPLG